MVHRMTLGGSCRTKASIGNREIESAGFEREKQCKQQRQLFTTPWDSYVKGDLSIVSTSNLPAEAQIDVANFSVALFASQITRLSYAKSSLSRSLSLSPARPMLIVSDHEEYPQSGRMFYFLPQLFGDSSSMPKVPMSSDNRLAAALENC